MDLILPVGALPVFWDINKCPVADDCDARRVGPWIKRFLWNLGYLGPIATNAVGRLSKVPYNILKAVSSSGISLYDIPYGHKDIVSLVFIYYMRNQHPTKIMLISPPQRYPILFSEEEKREGRDIILPFPFPDSCTKADAKILWQNALGTDAKDDNCSETVVEHAIWVCGVCDNLAGRGFVNYTMHVYCEKHARMLVMDQREKMGFPTIMPSEDDLKRGREEEDV